MNGEPQIIMLGTHADACGGIASVIDVYRRHGLFERRHITYLPTHCSGSALERIRMFIATWLTYAGMLIRRRVALAHVHSAVGTSFWRKATFLLPSFLFGVPTVLHLHSGRFPQFYATAVIAKALMRFIGKRVSCIVTVSDALNRWVAGTIRTDSTVTVCNPMLMPKSSDFGGRKGGQLLFLGKLGKPKGSHDLLHAVHLLLARHPDLKLVMGGDGDINGTREEIARLGIARNIELRGWVSGAEKQALLERSGIYVLPSYSEGLPMSVLEAMATGLVVVATRVGGIPEAVTDGKEGILIQPGDVTALAQALERLLTDAALRQQMGNAGRARVASAFAADVAIPLIEEVYDRLGVATLSRTSP